MGGYIDGQLPVKALVPERREYRLEPTADHTPTPAPDITIRDAQFSASHAGTAARLERCHLDGPGPVPNDGERPVRCLRVTSFYSLFFENTTAASTRMV